MWWASEPAGGLPKTDCRASPCFLIHKVWGAPTTEGSRCQSCSHAQNRAYRTLQDKSFNRTEEQQPQIWEGQYQMFQRMWQLFKRHLYILHNLPTELDISKNQRNLRWQRQSEICFSENSDTSFRQKSWRSIWSKKKKSLTWKCNLTFAKICFCPFPSSCQLTSTYGNFLPNKFTWKKADKLVLWTSETSSSGNLT